MNQIKQIFFGGWESSVKLYGKSCYKSRQPYQETTKESYYILGYLYYKLQQKNYCRLHKKFITYYDSSNFPKLLMIIKNRVIFCYKLQFSKLLQISSKTIVSCGRDYKLRRNTNQDIFICLLIFSTVCSNFLVLLATNCV